MALRTPCELIAELAVTRHSEDVETRMDGAWRLVRRMRRLGYAALADLLDQQAVVVARQIAVELEDAGQEIAA